MSTAWLWSQYPVDFEGDRTFDCAPLDPVQCAYYQERWHFWYIADLVFGRGAVAFFMSVIGFFVVVYLASFALRLQAIRTNALLQKLLALFRYASYRGFEVRVFRWYSAPIGLLLLALIGTIFFLCMDLIPQPYYWSSEIFGHSPPLGTRSGWMALACMPFVFATASKANWLTLLTGVSHERLQVFHRWIAYAFFLLALMHTFPFVVYHTWFGDIQSQVTVDNIFEYWTGIAAIILQAWLSFASHSTIRKLGYEFFKATHILTVILFVVVFFWHCGGTLTSWDYFVATAAIYVPCLAYSFIRTLFEHGVCLQAIISVEQNGHLRIEVPGNFAVTPGQHCFIRVTSFGLRASMTSHPFTVCSTPDDKGLVFFIQRRRGLTNKLYDLTQKFEAGVVTTKVSIDGPYGGIDVSRFDASSQIVIIVGSSGAGWSFPLIARFLSNRTTNNITSESESGSEMPAQSPEKFQTRLPPNSQTLRIIVAAKDTDTLKWFTKSLQKLVEKHTPSTNKASLFDVRLYLTSDLEDGVDAPSDSADIKKQLNHSSTTLRLDGSEESSLRIAPFSQTLSAGRPQLPALLHDEAVKMTGRNASLGVFACGPSSMQNDIRNSVARENLDIAMGRQSGLVYLHQEHFSWA